MAHFLISAGPTREYIDDVRYLSNASSGKMGFALAKAVISTGSTVHVVTGPVCLKPPKEALVTNVTSALEMEGAMRAGARKADIVIMTAAVADFRPLSRRKGKIKKSSNPTRGGCLRLDLVENPDILAGLGRRRGKRGQFLVGFALESGGLVEAAKNKLMAKRADLIVANTLDSMMSDKTRITLLHKDGTVEKWPELTKTKAAKRLIQKALDIWTRGKE